MQEVKQISFYDYFHFYLFIYLLANSVNTKCRPSKLIAILSCKIILDQLEQGAHCLVNFFIINIEQIIV